MEERAVKLLTEHLPYELDMLDAAYLLLHARNPASELDPVTKNMAIESFWLHVRNLQEFFQYPKRPTAQGVAAAADFTTTGFPLDLNIDRLVDKINDQINHLRYERGAGEQAPKLDPYERHRAKQAIDSAIQKFEANLTGEAKKYWKSRQRIVIEPHFTGASPNFTSTFAGWTGPTADSHRAVLSSMPPFSGPGPGRSEK